MRQARKEVPRWKRGRQPEPAIRLSLRQERELVGRLTAQGTAAGHASPVPGSRVMAQTGAFRFRMHLIPFGWLAALLAAGAGAHAARAVPVAAIAGTGVAAVIVLLSRHLSPWARKAAAVLALLTAFWLPLLAALGASRPWPGLLAVSFACFLVPWVRRYRWRPAPPQPEADLSDAAIFARLAAKNRWSGHLGKREDLPKGGRRYPIILDGAETHIGQVIAEPRRIAAAWAMPVTEAYAEVSPDGIESTGYLTLLRGNTLAVTREWDGAAMDAATGLAVIGRYPDEQPARVRFYACRDGTRNGLIAGATGSGKSYLLDLLIRLALTSGIIVPVILDPQEGQSLPQWRGHLPYAAGVEECMDMLRRVHAGMMLRSQDLAVRPWTETDGHHMTGFDFYDPFITGLPVVLVIGDELPVLLTGTGRQDEKRAAEAIALVKGIAKLGRKTGVALWPVTQVPSLEELGSQVVRSMLAGGNVVCLRTGDRVSGGMLGLAADPSELPRYFRDGQPTYGLGYVIGPDNRQAPARVDLVPRKLRRLRPAVPPLDPVFAMVMERATRGRTESTTPSPAPSLAPVPFTADDGPAGRSASDAILAVLTGEMTRGEIILAANAQAVQWGRDKPFATRTFGLALEKLTAEKRISRREGREGIYAPSRPSLHAVTATSPVSL